MNKTIYARFPRTSVEILEFGRKLCSRCENRMGFKVYAPCISPDLDAPDIALGEVVEAREHPLNKAALIVLYLDEPSWDAFADLQDAIEKQKDIIILQKEGNIIEYPLLDATDTIQVVEFSNHEEALDKIEIAILEWQSRNVRHKLSSIPREFPLAVSGTSG
jgi:hypothetical protein